MSCRPWAADLPRPCADHRGERTRPPGFRSRGHLCKCPTFLGPNIVQDDSSQISNKCAARRGLTRSEIEDGELSDVVDGESTEGLVVFREVERTPVERVDTVVHQRMRLYERQSAGRQLQRTVSTLHAAQCRVRYDASLIALRNNDNDNGNDNCIRIRMKRT